MDRRRLSHFQFMKVFYILSIGYGSPAITGKNCKETNFKMLYKWIFSFLEQASSKTGYFPKLWAPAGSRSWQLIHGLLGKEVGWSGDPKISHYTLIPGLFKLVKFHSRTKDCNSVPPLKRRGGKKVHKVRLSLGTTETGQNSQRFYCKTERPYGQQSKQTIPKVKTKRWIWIAEHSFLSQLAAALAAPATFKFLLQHPRDGSSWTAWAPR